MLTVIYLACWFFCGAYYALRWAIVEDRRDQEWRKVDQSLWDDLRDIEKMITSAIPKPGKKKRGVGGFRKNEAGEYYTCILCGERSNSRGKYCDEHDDE